MGVLPLQFPEGVSAQTLELDGTETFDVLGLSDDIKPHERRHAASSHRADGTTEKVAAHAAASIPPSRSITSATAASCPSCCGSCWRSGRAARNAVARCRLRRLERDSACAAQRRDAAQRRGYSTTYCAQHNLFALISPKAGAARELYEVAKPFRRPCWLRLPSQSHMNEPSRIIVPSHLTRRTFLKRSAAAAGGAALVGSLPVARFAHAAGSTDEIKLALIGCGGRGSGAANQALSTSNQGPVKLIAMADVHEDRLEQLARQSAEAARRQGRCAEGAAVPRLRCLQEGDRAGRRGDPCHASRLPPDACSRKRCGRAKTSSWKSRWPPMPPACAACSPPPRKRRRRT